MMTAIELRDRGVDRATLGIVTPESEPLRLFGDAAGGALREMLDAPRHHAVDRHPPPSNYARASSTSIQVLRCAPTR